MGFRVGGLKVLVLLRTWGGTVYCKKRSCKKVLVKPLAFGFRLHKLGMRL